ncbi:hypothetical protein CDAR_544491 [Caerostris darwini]|uniref:Uncharacterized protein n=1 Tax=Caerostris darwini TaxID=1538125 RepID=A0AAV4TCR9_9ARAC|nr:hypothetical protein CDAR_544491 [Caerostris darwini]
MSVVERPWCFYGVFIAHGVRIHVFEKWHFKKGRIDHQNCGTENRNRRRSSITERVSLTVDSCLEHFKLVFTSSFFPVNPGKGHNKDREKGHKMERKREKIAWERSGD